jgi:hypothetical protein
LQEREHNNRHSPRRARRVVTESRARTRTKSCSGLAWRASSLRCLPTRRFLTGIVLLAFAFQFGRFYLATSSSQDLCPEQFQLRPGNFQEGHGHDELQEPADPNPEGGPYFRHCKEHIYRMGPTHAQTLKVPEVISIPWAQFVAIASSLPQLPFQQNNLTKLFHPPRHIS